MAMLRRPWTLAGALLLGAAWCCAAQSTPEYQAKIVLMDKLTRFVDWPAGGDPQRAFVLAVLGRTPFGDELDSYFARASPEEPAGLRALPAQLLRTGGMRPALHLRLGKAPARGHSST